MVNRRWHYGMKILTTTPGSFSARAQVLGTCFKHQVLEYQYLLGRPARFVEPPPPISVPPLLSRGNGLYGRVTRYVKIFISRRSINTIMPTVGVQLPSS